MLKFRLISLPPGRNAHQLSEQDIKRASSTFLGFDRLVNTRYEQGSNTRFLLSNDDDGNEYGEIIFSEDIYPGRNVINPNSSLSLPGAAAHELAHFHRWVNKTELPAGDLTEIDEAMTSLEAAIRYNSKLDESDIQGLIGDALYRLNNYVRNFK